MNLLVPRAICFRWCNFLLMKGSQRGYKISSAGFHSRHHPPLSIRLLDPREKSFHPKRAREIIACYFGSIGFADRQSEGESTLSTSYIKASVDLSPQSVQGPRGQASADNNDKPVNERRTRRKKKTQIPEIDGSCQLEMGIPPAERQLVSRQNGFSLGKLSTFRQQMGRFPALVPVWLMNRPRGNEKERGKQQVRLLGSSLVRALVLSFSVYGKLPWECTNQRRFYYQMPHNSFVVDSQTVMAC